MKVIRFFLLLCLSCSAIAEQAPWARPDIAVSGRDRVYCADQTSNTVSVIDPAENKVKGVIYVGRSPHEAFFTPNGQELWVTVRGENYVSVIDPAQMKETRRIELANGPG